MGAGAARGGGVYVGVGAGGGGGVLILAWNLACSSADGARVSLNPSLKVDVAAGAGIDTGTADGDGVNAVDGACTGGFAATGVGLSDDSGDEGGAGGGGGGDGGNAEAVSVLGLHSGGAFGAGTGVPSGPLTCGQDIFLIDATGFSGGWPSSEGKFMVITVISFGSSHFCGLQTHPCSDCIFLA